MHYTRATQRPRVQIEAQRVKRRGSGGNTREMQGKTMLQLWKNMMTNEKPPIDVGLYACASVRHLLLF